MLASLERGGDATDRAYGTAGLIPGTCQPVAGSTLTQSAVPPNPYACNEIPTTQSAPKATNKTRGEAD